MKSIVDLAIAIRRAEQDVIGLNQQLNNARDRLHKARNEMEEAIDEELNRRTATGVES